MTLHWQVPAQKYKYLKRTRLDSTQAQLGKHEEEKNEAFQFHYR